MYPELTNNPRIIKDKIAMIESAIKSNDKMWETYNKEENYPIYIKNLNFLTDYKERLLQYDSELHESQIVKKYCNLSVGSDCLPYEVIRKVSDKTVEIRAMKATKVPLNNHRTYMNIKNGYCSNNYEQEYNIINDESKPVIRARWSTRYQAWKSDFGFHTMSDTAIKFHDYNF